MLSVLFGILLLIGGLAFWSLETEYGGDNVVGAEAGPDGVWRVFDEAEEGSPATIVVFEGSEAEAQAFMEARHRTGRNYVMEGSVIAVGALLVLWGLLAPRLQKKPVS